MRTSTVRKVTRMVPTEYFQDIHPAQPLLLVSHMIFQSGKKQKNNPDSYRDK